MYSHEIAFDQGRVAAQQGKFRVCKEGYKILTPEWKAWYAGYDYATNEGENVAASEKAMEDRYVVMLNNMQG